MNTERISREACNIQIAGLIALRGTCARLQVGAVITLDNHIVATGYNGPGKGQEHCNAFMCNTNEPCKRAIHAEANAIAKIPNMWRGDYILYCTHQPCYECAKKIVKAEGINIVYYLHPFRDQAGIELLNKHNIKTIQIDEQGRQQA